MLEEAERDHRKIGREMELFMMSDFGPGSPFWLPNGMAVRNALTDYWHEMMVKFNYEEVLTPQILAFFVETSATGSLKRICIPRRSMRKTLPLTMNCPGACLIYKNRRVLIAIRP